MFAISVCTRGVAQWHACVMFNLRCHCSLSLWITSRKQITSPRGKSKLPMVKRYPPSLIPKALTSYETLQIYNFSYTGKPGTYICHVTKCFDHGKVFRCHRWTATFSMLRFLFPWPRIIVMAISECIENRSAQNVNVAPLLLLLLLLFLEPNLTSRQTSVCHSVWRLQVFFTLIKKKTPIDKPVTSDTISALHQQTADILSV